MKVLVIANQSATAMMPHLLATILGLLSRGTETDIKISYTLRPGHGALLAREAALSKETEAIIAAGGDGTVNEVVNGLLSEGVGQGAPVLGVIPLGATNVFARSIGMPDDPVGAAGVLASALIRGTPRRISVGKVDERFFLFCAGIGFDAAVIERVVTRRQRGRRSTLALTLGAALGQFFVDNRIDLQMTRPGERQHSRLKWIVVANSDPWTFLNEKPVRLTPDASFDTGLDVYARLSMWPIGVLGSAVRAVSRAPQQQGRKVRTEHDLDCFEILANRPVPLQVDGEFIGRRERMNFISAPDALSVLVPLN